MIVLLLCSSTSGPGTIIGAGGANGGGIASILYSSGPQVIDSRSDVDGYLATDSLQYTIDLGIVSGVSCQETVATIQASITSRIEVLFEDFDDDNSMSGLGAVYLELLAYEGCTDATSCASVTPTTLVPGRVPIHAVNMAMDIGDQDDATFLNDFLSTDQAMFVLDEGSGSFFLQAVFSLYTAGLYIDSSLNATEMTLPYDVIVNNSTRKLEKNRSRRLTYSDVQVTVDSWVIVINNAQNAARPERTSPETRLRRD